MQKVKPEGLELQERLISVSRVSKVVKGGKRFGFRAIVAVGNGDGVVGLGIGKAKEVPDAVRKAVERAKKSLFSFPRRKTTITHEVLGKYGAGSVVMKPASPGTGVIAGGPVRAIMEVAGIRDILTKSLGTNNPVNVAHATLQGLMSLKDPREVAHLREKNSQDFFERV
ncbi:MAG TPA: 30S ribosomal protein S5 [Atribacter sp.]|jgi:small subunit ribosomal protein S5|uniref:30S ribosomal protein S5 n=1 Tax=Atribacter sp. TaxID=2847780 RepID=UPI00176CC434|nr:30S ribosomal protein S5 [Atribacter sp.]MDD3713850.1 30S ribosomal protein S5 [Atribacterota bacterium]MDI9593973.1 30S ribosomal protein S5 [Atribacterota bacterium]HHT11078.1 30S ribosomal protein S5 [Candidatus Atribacteria bacterium]HQK84157.1 30S ribosomal protein S5 [Atribacter sp.]